MIDPAFEILNQRGTPMFFSDVFANRPTAGIVGRIFISTDTKEFYRDTGTTWELIGGPGSGTITGSGAANQVAFWDSASSITGENNLWWDATNNYLGINTNTPSVPLDVHHASNNGAILNQTTGTNNNLLAFQTSGNGRWRIGNFYNAGADDFGIFDVIGNIQPFTIAKTSGQTFIGSKITASGRLVVNSSSSDAHIQVVGANAPSVRIDNAGSGATQRFVMGLATATNNFIQGSTAGDICISTASASPLLFGMWQSINASEVMRITTSNNLLIGSTTDLGYKLYVNGAIGTNGSVTIGNGGTGTSYLYALSGSDLILNAGGDRVTIRQTGNVIINNLSGSGTRMVVADANGVLSTQAIGSGSITGSGTTNYVPKFTSGSVIGNSLIVENGTNLSYSGSSIDINPSSGQPNITLRSGNTFRGYIEGNSSGGMSFGAGSSANIYQTITSSGNIGIGVSNPLSLVHANNGDYRVSNDTSTTYRGYVFGASATDSGEYSYLKWAASSGELRLWANPASFGGFFSIYSNGSEALRVTSGRNILIGTTTDSGDKLNVVGNIALNAGYKFYNGGSSNSAGIDFDSSYVNLSGYNGIRFFASNTGVGSMSQRMFLDSNGNLGLGVTPSAWSVGNYKAFQIGNSGSLWSATGTGGDTYLGTNYYFNGNYVYQNNGFASDYYQYQGTHNWRIASSGTAGNVITFTQPMTLAHTGNLLIGTTTDAGYKLDVNGTGIFRGVITQTSSFAEIILNRTGGTTFGTGVKLQTSGTNNWIIGTAQASVGTDFSIYNYGVGGGALNITYGNNNIQIGSITDDGEKLKVVGTSRFTTFMGVGTGPDASTMLYVKGADTSSTNFAAVFQNSAGTNLVRFFNNGKVNMSALPTSSAGLSAGDIWNDAGTLKIV